MRKILLTAAVAAFSWTNPVQAMTKPDDMINLVLTYEDFVGGKTLPANKRYTKKWKDVKLADKTRALLMSKNQQFDTSGEKFRLHFMMLLNDDVLRVTFLGDKGGFIMMGMHPKSMVCHLNFDGNGGFLTGRFSKGCVSAFPMPD